jgi:hypothetical protein
MKMSRTGRTVLWIFAASLVGILVAVVIIQFVVRIFGAHPSDSELRELFLQHRAAFQAAVTEPSGDERSRAPDPRLLGIVRAQSMGLLGHTRMVHFEISQRGFAGMGSVKGVAFGPVPGIGVLSLDQVENLDGDGVRGRRYVPLEGYWYLYRYDY